MHYRKIVKRKSNDEVFHDETGYWMWDPREQVIMHSLAIPRAVCLIAGANYVENKTDDGRFIIDVFASVDDAEWNIVQSPFMLKNARTISFKQKIIVGNKKLTYSEITMLDIYGKVFEHTDDNELVLV